MIENYKQVIGKYTAFSGRARRKEYWTFFLANFLIGFITGAVLGLLGLEEVSTAVWVIYSLLILLPSVALSFRRLHDTNRSAWWLLLALIPFIGAIVLIVFYALPGTKGSNKYGPDPKQEPAVS